MKKKIVVISGAGISAESGLDTFRDSNGLWANHKIEEVATIEAWNRNPQLVLNFYNKRREELSKVRPNAAHLFLAELESKFDVDIITQNVDNLHERAGSTRVLHLHGELTKVRPENSYNDKDSYSEESILDIRYENVNLGDLAVNGSQLRPHIVFFGEAVPKIERAIDLVSKADILLIIGTSLSVYPAAGLYRYASFDSKIYIINPEKLDVDNDRIIQIQATATEGVKILEQYLNK